jgi:hypothetical protein
MKTVAYFGGLWGEDWPSVEWLEPHFHAPPGGVSPLQARRGGGRFEIDEEGHVATGDRRISAKLLLFADPKYGLLLDLRRSVDGMRESFVSKGNLQRRLEWVKTPQGTPLSIGLFVPIETGWAAVKQFIETKGAQPTAIEWVSEQDLPSDTFPTPDRWKHLKFEAT